MLTLISPMLRSEWRGDLTLFNGFYDTMPTDEINDASLQMLVATVALVDEPVLVKLKENAPYFVPCRLQDAPYIGKTLERAQRENWPSLIGRQRSASHVTASSLLKYDLDGMTAEQWATVLDKLNASGLAFISYSTWSCGLKYGVRVRILIPIDRALVQVEYSTAWHGGVALLFPELIGVLTPDGGVILDTSAAKIHQQQSVWCTSRDRAGLAFRIIGKGGIASADTLIAAAPAESVKPARKYSDVIGVNADLGIFPGLARLTAALPWIDANNYGRWISTGHVLKALAVAVGEDEAYGLWVTYSDQSNAPATDDVLETKWGGFHPTLSADVAVSTLLGIARDSAAAAIEVDIKNGSWTDRGKSARIYLGTYHRAAYEKIKAGGSI